MLKEDIKTKIIRQLKQEVYNNPNKTYYGLYKDYSNCKGTIYGQEDNIYIITTSSVTYANLLRDNGYTIYIQTDGDKIIKIEKQRDVISNEKDYI
jgi:hypothetical protein